MEPEIRYCTTADGVSIAYYTMGEGLPLVVTSNVLWSDLRHTGAWEYYRSGTGLGRGLQVVRYDARGAGLSDRRSLDFSMDARLLDLEAVVERLKLNRFAILGTRHATPAAIAYAVAHPERVSHLVLVAGYARGRDQRETSKSFDSMREAADEDAWVRYTLTVASTYLNFSDSEAAREMASHFRESMTQESALAFQKAQEAVDVTDLLPRVAMPTLVVYRTLPGYAIGLERSRELASKIPDARFVTVSGPDSQLWTDELTRIVEEFLGVNHQAPAPSPSDALPAPGRTASASRTIIYTDIEGNTGMLQRLGDDAWRAVLRDHERITRECLQVHGGTEVKTMGDGFMASFDSATSAVQCAIELQRSLAARNSTAAEPVLVRVGLHAGEPIEEDDDLFGTAVTIAARIMGQGAGGEILVSDLVRGLVAGKGFTFTDRGEFAMKGFDDAARLYEVRWRD